MLKKIIKGIFLLSFLSGCAQSSAFLGPVYTFGTTGNIYQSGLTYSSNRAITSLTGKSPEENITNLFKTKKKNSELQKLVKRRIKETRKKLNFNP
tara:strand:- start:530 stop:814 length:285 start_codon:yes stop_codon:yes gene_type:complete